MINLRLNINERINKIYLNEIFLTHLNDILVYENTRVFCKHNMEHFLDVARIMYIINLEENFNFSKDIIYASALLHDIGRAVQYKDGIEHNVASSLLARKILIQCNFTNFEIDIICTAIQNHRKVMKLENCLSSLLYISDKLSRNCFSCNERKDCNWHMEKMNLQIKY